MTVTQARSIITNQTCVHDDLLKVLAKHKQNEFKRPVAEHTVAAFEEMLDWLADWRGDVILDACCGVGESTINIANEYPATKIIGIDKSLARLDKHQSYVAKNESVNALSVNPAKYTKELALTPAPNNYLLLQADLNDFWRLLLDYMLKQTPKWQITKQYILYPNPYPKKSQLGKRWHGGALFGTILGLCTHIEVRSNWRLYIEEFLIGAEFYGLSGSIDSISENDIEKAYTPFERKYLAAGQTCFKLVIRP